MWFFIWMFVGFVVVVVDMTFINRDDYVEVDTLFWFFVILFLFSLFWPALFSINCYGFMLKKRTFWFNK